MQIDLEKLLKNKFTKQFVILAGRQAIHRGALASEGRGVKLGSRLSCQVSKLPDLSETRFPHVKQEAAGAYPGRVGRIMGSACTVPGLCPVCAQLLHELNVEQQVCTSSSEIFPRTRWGKISKPQRLVSLYFL